jgi:hypothetical protein
MTKIQIVLRGTELLITKEELKDLFEILGLPMRTAHCLKRYKRESCKLLLVQSPSSKNYFYHAYKRVR